MGWVVDSAARRVHWFLPDTRADSLVLVEVDGSFEEPHALAAVAEACWIADRDEPLFLAPLLGSYGLLLVAAWVLVRRRIRRHIALVEWKLAAMGVPSRPEFEAISPPAE